MNSTRKPHGAVLPFIGAATFVIVLLGGAFVSLLMLIGGSRQGTNANDAGTLNVARCAPLVQVAGGSDGDPFRNISPTDRFDLTNINDVLGKTLLVNLNEQAMQQQGLSTPASSSNAAQVWTSAQAISGRLSTALNTRKNLEGFHQSVADRNRVNMLSAKRTVDVTGKWRTSCMNRGAESNINFNLAQLPPGITKASLGNPVVRKVDPRTGKVVELWMGYHGIKAAGRYINFVSFELGGLPHHVSLKTFRANTPEAAEMTWTSPVPNAFESLSSVEDDGLRNHIFDSAALCHVNERTLEPPKIEDGFIRFRLGKDTMRYVYRLGADHHLGGWRYPGIHTLPKLDRGPYSDDNINDPTFPSTFKLAFSYGHQYHDPSNGNEPTLFMALFGMGNPNDPNVYGNLKAMIKSRANQIKPGTTWPQIAALLHATSIKNNLGPFKLQLVGSSLAIVPDADNSVVADGQKVRTVNGSMTDSQNKLHYVEHVPGSIPLPHGMAIQKFHKTEWTHHIDMTPGTGANKALLDIVQDDDAIGTFSPTPF